MIAQFKNVSKFYQAGDGISNISFSVAPGQIIGLLGLNGSGKTTIMKLLCGLLHPDSGEITIAGKSPRAGRSNLAFMNDRQSFPSWMTPKDIARFMSNFYADFSIERFNEMMNAINVPTKEIGEMSRGERQKLKIVALMARDTHLYLLDEPLSGIDLVARTGILKVLLQNWSENSSVILSTHEINDADPFLDRALFMEKGTLVSDENLEDVRQSGQSVADRFLTIMGAKP